MKKKTTSFFYCFASLVFAVILAVNIFSYVKTAQGEIRNKEEMVVDEILVKFKGVDQINVVKLAQSDDFNEILKDFNKNYQVEYAEPNYLYKASIIPSDSYYNKQWYLEKIKAPQAWDQVREGKDIVIAVLDSGVEINHPDLRDNIWRNVKEAPGNKIDDDRNGFIDDAYGWDFVNDVSDPSPKFLEGFTEAGIFHGTIISGIIAASGNNATGITGIAWGAKIMPLKVLGDAGEGNTVNVVRAIDYAIANGADVINLSFVGFGFSQSLDNAIKRAYDAGIIVVAAAGNEQDEGSGYFLDETPMYPACHDGSNGENRVIGVAATDALDQKAHFSSFGTKCVDISAPGVSIFSTIVYEPSYLLNGKIFNKYYDGYWSGTSMAAPMVSAAAALVIEANPRLSRNQVVASIIDSADNINRLNPEYLNKLGRGRLNLQSAIVHAKDSLVNKSINLLVSPYSRRIGVVKTTDENGKGEDGFNAYSVNFLGGVNLTSGDVDGDGLNEIITGAGQGGGPHVRIFNTQGEVKNQFFAFDNNFRGGVKVASCDTNGDGVSEVIAGAGQGGDPQVRIFDRFGNLKKSFLAYSSSFRGGVNIACGDVDGDGKNEIITGAGENGGPQVRIFDSNGRVEGQFFAYDSRFRGGVIVTTGDIDGGARSKKAEIITAPGSSGGPHIRIFDNYGKEIDSFFAYSANFRGGVNLASGDIDNDGFDEIITGARSGGAPHVRVFESNGDLIGSFYAYEENFSGGVSVGTIVK